MKIYIRKNGMTEDMLAYLGYRKTEEKGENTWEAGRIGIPHPDIHLIWGPVRYRETQQDLLQTSGMREEDLARMLLTDLSGIRKITSGTIPASDTDLEMLSGILHLEAAPLRKGIRLQLPDLEKELETCRKLLQKVREELEEQLKKTEEITGNERFFVKPAKDGGYLIFDAVVMDFVKGTDRRAVLFSSPVKALDAAYRLEKERPHILPSGTYADADREPDISGAYVTRKEEGLTCFYDRDRFDPDGSERLLAVADADGDTAVVADLTEDEEAALLDFISEKTAPEKSRAEEKNMQAGLR